MPRRAASGHHDSVAETPASSQPRTWKLEDAKTRFSEVVRRARTEGPQRVTVRGKNAVFIIAAESLERMLPQAAPHQNLVDFLQNLGVADLDLARERDDGRDNAL